MAIVASMQPESDQIILYARSSFPHLIWFSCGSYLNGLFRFRPYASGPEANRSARIIRPSSGRMQLAHYLFPTFSSFRLGWVQLQMAQNPDHIVENQPGSSLVFGWLCQNVTWQIQSGSKPVIKNHQAHFWPMLQSQCWSEILIVVQSDKIVYLRCCPLTHGSQLCTHTITMLCGWCSTSRKVL